MSDESWVTEESCTLASSELKAADHLRLNTGRHMVLHPLPSPVTAGHRTSVTEQEGQQTSPCRETWQRTCGIFKSPQFLAMGL